MPGDKIETVGLETELGAALAATGASFHVHLISTFGPSLVWAPADTDAEEWLAAHHPDFDQFPVKSDETTLGVLIRGGEHRGKTAREAMQPLRDGLIVSADMPIASLIPDLGESHFRLVLRGGRIDGLVTQSDLLKLPVRMLLFGLISHLELCLRALVRQRLPGQTWMGALNADRRRSIEQQLTALKVSRFEPDPLEFTMFSDVVGVLSPQLDLGNSFTTDMDSVRELRNSIAHAKTYVESSNDVRRFVALFERLRHWIESISEKLKVST